jgi:hypothetical protein
MTNNIPSWVQYTIAWLYALVKLFIADVYYNAVLLPTFIIGFGIFAAVTGAPILPAVWTAINLFTVAVAVWTAVRALLDAKGLIYAMRTR